MENLPEEILDYLAVEWGLPYYEDTLDHATKVRLLKEGFGWRQSAGTVEGVEKLVIKMFGEGAVSEWHEYGGVPGHFKVTTNAKMVEDLKEFFKILMTKEKNVRSVLDCIEVTRDVENSGKTALNLVERYRIEKPIRMNPIE